MSCPWEALGPRGNLHRVCEENLCAWLVEPGNTASNVGYLVVGLWILWCGRGRSDRTQWFGYVALIIAITSSMYHATNSGYARFADYLSIYLITGVMTAMNLDRWRGIRSGTQRAIAIGLPALLIAGVAVEPAAAFWILVLGMPCCAIEMRLIARDWRSTNYRNYLLAWLMGGLAVIAWAIDPLDHVCRPHWHGLTGHSAWHLLSAGFLLFIWRFYRQFSDSTRDAAEHQTDRR